MRQIIIANPIEALIKEATRYIGSVENPGNNNRSILIDYWNFEAIQDWRDFPMGGCGAPWCAAFVHGVGKQALGVGWPLPRTGMVQTLVDWAKTKGVFYLNGAKVGDLLVLFYPTLVPPRYGHVGIVTEANADTTFSTIEGNTNPGGSREGYGVFRRQRNHTDRCGFIRWIEAI